MIHRKYKINSEDQDFSAGNPQDIDTFLKYEDTSPFYSIGSSLSPIYASLIYSDEQNPSRTKEVHSYYKSKMWHYHSHLF
jgi:hypothetical protein